MAAGHCLIVHKLVTGNWQSVLLAAISELQRVVLSEACCCGQQPDPTQVSQNTGLFCGHLEGETWYVGGGINRGVDPATVLHAVTSRGGGTKVFKEPYLAV